MFYIPESLERSQRNRRCILDNTNAPREIHNNAGLRPNPNNNTSPRIITDKTWQGRPRHAAGTGYTIKRLAMARTTQTGRWDWIHNQAPSYGKDDPDRPLGLDTQPSSYLWQGRPRQAAGTGYTFKLLAMARTTQTGRWDWIHNQAPSYGKDDPDRPLGLDAQSSS